MIPIRLELKNFMSYGESVEPLDFRGMHLACLSGDNGNGKSALLDAITWALWGEARAPADELIRLGSDEMRVIFDFQLGDDLYRVIRGRNKRSAGSSVWEVYVAENPEGATERQGEGANSELAHSPTLPLSHSLSWRPITGQGIRDTGRVIQRILRMDYKTFINSAYIQQGRADEFTKNTVADRKKILADILDLSRYDALEQKAKDRRNEAEILVQELEREIAHIEQELANEPGYQEELAKFKADRESLEAEIAKVEARLRELQGKHAELQATLNRTREMERSLQGWQREIENLLAQKRDQERRVARSREVLADKVRIADGLGKLHSVRERIALLDRGLQDLRRLEHDRSGLEQQVLAEKHKLDIERQSLAKELSELETRIRESVKLEADAASLREQVKALDGLDVRRAQLQRDTASESDRWTNLKGQYERMLQVKEDLEGKVKLLSEGGKCPLCQTEIQHEKHESILSDYNRQIEDADVRIREVRRDGADAKSKRDAAQQESARIDEHLKAGLEVRRRLAQAEQVLFQIEQYRGQMPDVKARLDGVLSKLGSDDFAKDLRVRAAEVSAGIEALKYSPDEHQRIRDELSGLEQFESLSAALKLAEESLPADEQSLKTTADLIEARERSIEESRKSIAELSASLGELPQIASEISQINTSLVGLRDSDRQVTGTIARLEHSLDRCKALRTEIAGKSVGLEKARTDRTMYGELVAAFGKKGVQALIIENAIPEIQEETNRLLARMTDNAMQVSIETVRDKKTGGTAETLDIRISDDMGTRSYELFSGGEAFRINFTLRIALSKLLARRAGARLQTLIIDEGFGTQDGKGREKLIEAIDSIRDDFELILVITHIDELKDAFQTRIEVTKDSHGSQISVN